VKRLLGEIDLDSQNITQQAARVIRNALKTKQKNGDGWIPASFPPPVRQLGKFSRLAQAGEKRVISKALTEWAGYRPLRLMPVFPLSSAVFSAGWELRQFSTQLGLSAKSSD
jgi:hypothetical protein